jgi:hypothetical protein
MEVEIWQLALSTVGTISGLILAINQFEKLSSKTKAGLKSDLEILKSIPHDDPSFKVLSESIHLSISEIYKKKDSRFGKIRFYYGFTGTVMCVLSSLWIYASYSDLDIIFYIKLYAAMFGFFLLFYAVLVPGPIVKNY